MPGKVTDTSNVSEDDDSAADEGFVKRERHTATGLSGGESKVCQGQESLHWNSDECVLCGMNGNLICCDGCPAAYHTRCVGISRASLPSGDWFCPECIIEKVNGEQGPRVESLRGGQLLGKDPYGRTFWSTCGYLLVLESIDGLQSSHKYYNKESITQVLQSLEMLKPACDKVVKAICQQWQISISRSAISETKGVDCLKELGRNLHGEVGERDACLERLENLPDSSCMGLETRSPTCSAVLDLVAGLGNQSVGLSSNQLPALSLQRDQGMGAPDSKASACHQQADSNGIEISNSDVKQLEGRLESYVGLSPACNSPLSQAKGCFLDLTSPPTETLQLADKGPVYCPLPRAADAFESKILKETLLTSANASQSRRLCNDGDGYLVQKRGFSDIVTSIPQEFTQPYKFTSPSSYFNHYLFGDVAATAAANLATVTAEEVTSLGKGLKRKTGVTTIAEQLKAFQKTPVRFFWPNHKKKLMEHPKEKCGWCHSCCSLSLKKGCLMNQAAIHLAAGAAAVVGGIRPTKSGSGHLPAVAGYILHIEENMHSLLVGPWENIHFRKLWRKKVEQTATVHDLKTALLQLEVNLRPIVLSEDWSKSLEDVPQLFLGGSAACVISEALVKKSSSRSSSRRALTSRRGCSRSHMGAIESIQWLRRGKVAHRVSGWAILPTRVAKTAGRQGGLRRILGLSYAEGAEVSRRSKQFAWRARVQAACSVSELAVQVRSLDAHVRWGDLLSKVDFHNTGRKSEDIEALVKGHPPIHARSSKENMLIYLIDSALISSQDCQKKPALDIALLQESLQIAGKEQVWVAEHEVPLCMLKEFEERDRIHRQSKAPMLSLLQKHFIDGRKKTMKKDIFKCLSERAGIHMTPKLLLSVTCKLCSLKVLASVAVLCQVCKGPFHKECTVMASLFGSREPDRACRACFEAGIAKLQNKGSGSESSRQAESTLVRGISLDKESRSTLRLKLPFKLPTKKLSLNSGRKSPPRAKGEACSTPSHSTCTSSTGVIECDAKPESHFRLKVLTAAIKKPERSERIFWKKNALDCRVLEKNNLVLPGGLKEQAVGPKCHVCRQQYRSDLLYIKCGYCPLWFHGDAVGVSNTNYHEVVGFKCHKCRKKGSPSCPYDANLNKHRQTSREVLKCDGGKVVKVEGLQNAHGKIFTANNRAHLNTFEEQLQPLVSAACYMPKATSMKVDVPFEDHNFGSPTPCIEALLEASQCNLTVWPEVDCFSIQDVRSRVDGKGDSVLDDLVLPKKEEGTETVPLEANGDDCPTIEEVMQMLYNSDVGTSPQEISDDVCSRAPLSFTELLSSEEDWVEELAQIGMDFGLHTVKASDIYVDFVKNSSTSPLFCQRGAAESSETRSEQIVVHGSQIAHESSSLIAAEKTRGTACTISSDGFTQMDFDCVGGCGVSLHQQCLD